MPVSRFTAEWVKRVKPPETGRVDWWDDKSDIGLRVSHTGSKVWQVRYRAANGKRRRVVLGEYPTVSFADANERASAVLLDAAREKDPAAILAARKASPTIDALTTEYLERRVPQLRKHTQRNIGHSLRRDILPALGKRRAADVRRGDVVELLDRIVRRGAPSSAVQALHTLSALYNWAIARDMVEANPCHRVRVPAIIRPRDRWLSEDELRAVWLAILAERTTSGDLFRLCLLTGQRGGEVRQMRWQDIDLAAAWWTIPAAISKNGLSHRVPLSGPAHRILLRLRESARPDCDWVFTRSGKKPIGTLDNLSLRIRERSGVAHTMHDLRRTVSSHMAQLGISEESIGKVLNHAKTSVTGRHYIHHTYDAEKRRALDLWAEWLMGIVGQIAQT